MLFKEKFSFITVENLEQAAQRKVFVISAPLGITADNEFNDTVRSRLQILVPSVCRLPFFFFLEFCILL